MASGEVGSMDDLGIIEFLQVKRQVLISVAKAAEMILKVDDIIIKAAPRQRAPLNLTANTYTIGSNAALELSAKYQVKRLWQWIPLPILLGW